MKKGIVAALLFSSCLLLLSSCSYMTSFVLVNESGDPLKVEYVLKNRLPCEQPSCPREKPEKKSLRDLENFDIGWNELRQGDYSYDEAAGKVSLVLAPGEALRVERITNYGGHGKQDDPFFDIASIHLAGSSGEARYEGAQAQLQFRPEDSSLYTIRYY